MLLKLFYLGLFLSIDVLLYLRLVRKNTESGVWLAVAGSVWLIALVVGLPMFNLHLMPFKGFLGLSELTAALLLVHFFTRFLVWGPARFVTDDVKQVFSSMMFGINTIFFAIFFLLHLFIITAGYHG